MLRGNFAQKVNDFVRAGGTFVTTYVSGYVNEEDLCFMGGFPGPLREAAGIWAEEVDVLPSEQVNSFRYRDRIYECREYFELVHAQTAEVLAAYQNDFYAGMPAVTKNNFGKGRCYYLAARTGVDFLTALYHDAAEEQGIVPVLANLPHGVSATMRVGEGGRRYRFLLNPLPQERRIHLDKPQRDLLTDRVVSGDTVLLPRSVLVLTDEQEG